MIAKVTCWLRKVTCWLRKVEEEYDKKITKNLPVSSVNVEKLEKQ